MRRFASEYPDVEFVQQIAAQLPWEHLITLIYDVLEQYLGRVIYFRTAPDLRKHFNHK